MVIGKIMILSFSDTEENIMEKIMSIIGGESNMEYIKITSKLLTFKDLKIYLKEQEVFREDKRILLTNQEFLTLQFLAEHPGWVYTKGEIYNAVYGEKAVEDIDNTIYCLIRSLRKKLEADPRHPEYIHTVRGAGYKFVVSGE